METNASGAFKTQEITELEYEFDVTPGNDHQELTVRWGGHEILKNQPIETPSLPYRMLKFCYHGNGVLNWDEGRFEIQPGMVFWTAAKCPSTLKALPGQTMANYALFFAGKESAALFESYLRAETGATKLMEPQFILKIFRDLMDEGRSTSPHRDENCVLLTQVLFRRIAAQSLARLPTNALARQTFGRCREHIARNFMRLTSLREVAEACDVTVPYLCRLFDLFYDCSAYDYLTRLKMSRAENLLLRPSAPIHEVAGAVGYKDARLFARNFKAMFGKSPTEYRQVFASSDD
jgi:AraC-like DNA-binding protein